MKATDTELTKFLEGEKQYCVPIYQRKYSWGKLNCLEFLKDILAIARDTERPCHFMGSIIYLLKGNSQHASAVTEYLVIDGQQRLTTISILLLALGDYTKEKASGSDEFKCSVTNPERISKQYLINEYETNDAYYKIRLNEEDFYAWKKIIKNRTRPDDMKQNKIFENYNIIIDKLRKENVEPQLVYEGIKKLRLVDICLLPEDNAQLVFETVNSTGLPLSAADKIRNFLLMQVDSTEQMELLYNEYWHPMEKELGMSLGKTKEFDDFIYYYLTMIRKNQVTGDNYKIFKEYFFDNRSAGPESLVKQIRQYSKYYLTWINAKESGAPLDHLLYKVRSTNQLKITPAILKLLSDLDNGMLSDNDAADILTLMESYFMRRTICGMPTNTAGPVCLSMLKSLYNTHQLDAFRNNILELPYKQRMPKDDEMIEHLQKFEIYSLSKSKLQMILDRLENHNRKEHVSTNEYTIEHIMPRTLSADWEKDLGPDFAYIYETYVHTIGNLTLTGYNSEYQNKRFIDKLECVDKNGQKIGYKYTPIKLSRYVANCKTWGEAQIIERSKQLTNEMIQIWKYPPKEAKISIQKPAQKSMEISVPEFLAKTVEIPVQKAPEETESSFPITVQKSRKANDYPEKLFNAIEPFIMALSPNIERTTTKRYYSYKIKNVFAAIDIQKQRLKVFLYMPYEQVHFSDNSYREKLGFTLWERGANFFFEDLADIAVVMNLIEQSYKLHAGS